MQPLTGEHHQPQLLPWGWQGAAASLQYFLLFIIVYFYRRKHSLTTKYSRDSCATYFTSAGLCSPSLPAAAGWHGACVSQHPESFRASPEGGMKSRARNQGGENQFTTDLFLTASECWMKPSHSPWLEGLDRAWWLSHTSSSKRVVLAVPSLIKHLAGRLMGMGKLIKTPEYPSHHPILDDFHSYLLFLLPMGGFTPR